MSREGDEREEPESGPSGWLGRIGQLRQTACQECERERQARYSMVAIQMSPSTRSALKKIILPSAVTEGSLAP
jgi:hypothetical protein